MPATLVWGKGFQLVTSPDGHEEIFGIDGGTEFISWSSVEEIQALLQQHGLEKNIWPVYPDCEVDSEVPLGDAQDRCASLRIALDRIDARVIDENHWLEFIHRILRDGYTFFIMV